MSSHAVFPTARRPGTSRFNEYRPGSAERASLQVRLEQMRNERAEIRS